MSKQSQLVIRLARFGCTNRPFYRIVLTPGHKSQKEERVVEQLGTYDPMANKYNEKLVALNISKIKKHIGNGVAISKPVAELFGLAGLLPIHPMTYIRAKRNRNNLETTELDLESSEHAEEGQSQ